MPEKLPVYVVKLNGLRVFSGTQYGAEHQTAMLRAAVTALGTTQVVTLERAA